MTIIPWPVDYRAHCFRPRPSCGNFATHRVNESIVLFRDFRHVSLTSHIIPLVVGRFFFNMCLLVVHTRYVRTSSFPLSFFFYNYFRGFFFTEFYFFAVCGRTDTRPSHDRSKIGPGLRNGGTISSHNEKPFFTFK